MLDKVNEFQILKKKQKRNSRKSLKYSKVSDESRIDLINALKNEKITLKEASKKLKINYSTAKTIMRIYKSEERVLRKTTLRKTKIINSNFNDRILKTFDRKDTEYQSKYRKLKRKMLIFNKQQVESNFTNELKKLYEEILSVSEILKTLQNEFIRNILMSSLMFANVFNLINNQ